MRAQDGGAGDVLRGHRDEEERDRDADDRGEGEVRRHPHGAREPGRQVDVPHEALAPGDAEPDRQGAEDGVPRQPQAREEVGEQHREHERELRPGRGERVEPEAQQHAGEHRGGDRDGNAGDEPLEEPARRRRRG